jgi:hypothetical protein
MPKLYLLILTSQFIIAKKQDNIIIANNRTMETKTIKLREGKPYKLSNLTKIIPFALASIRGL